MTTTAAMDPPAPVLAVIRPEWIRIPQSGPCPHFGLSKAKYYQLILDGQIDSVSLRKPGKANCMRLISYESVSAYLQKLSSQQNQT